MPLLGRKLFEPGLSEEKKSSEEEFTIPHTNEVFYTEKAYKQRLALYNQRIWSCQCSGHVGLTHEEATKSELNCRKKLSTFGEVWEKPILKLVQHSYDSLDNIILQAHQMLQTRFVPEEKVMFQVKIPEKSFEATVVKYYERAKGEETGNETDESKAESSTPNTSPSSDKENKKRQALITDVFKSDARRSRRCSNVNSESDLQTKKKRLLPANYDILLSAQNTIVSKVPSEHLTRVEKPPNKESIRLFIRANAVRLWGGKDKLPWIVNEDMVFRHSLKAKISPEEELKMLKLGTAIQSNGVLDGDQVSPVSSGLIKGEPLTNGLPDKHAEDDENVSLAEVKKKQKLSSSVKNPDKTKAQKRKMTSDSKTKSKKSKHDKNQASKPNTVKNKLTGMDLFLSKVGKSPKKKKSKSSDDQIVVIDDDDEDDDKPLSSRFNSTTKSPKKTMHSASSRKNSTPKKKKQATLLELTKKGSGIKVLAAPSPSKSFKNSPRKPRQPRIALQLMSLKKEKKFRAHKYKMTIASACKILTEKQRENLPSEIKGDVITKWEFLEKKRKFEAMTPEERKAYLLQKKRERKEKAQAERASFPKKDEKFEDLQLAVPSQKQLPDLELRGLPENIPNSSFGDIAMLCEFLHSYHSLLCPKDPYFHKQFNIQTVSDAVTAGKTGFRITRKILVLLLQTLLADDVARDYCALDFPLNQISVTPEVSCELTRVCLRQHDDELGDESESGSNPDTVDTGLSDSTSRRLFEMELYEMHPVEQLEVISTLAYRVMNTYAVQSHMDDTMMKATTIWKKVIKQGVERKKEEKELKQEMNEKNTKITEENKSGSETPQEKKESDVVKSPSKMDLDLVSRVKQRKLLSERLKKEEAERKEKQRKEQDELFFQQKSKQEREKTKRQLAETRMFAVHVRRRIPLGTDRNHSRYWLFCDGVPGLYVEKGWIGDHIDYCTRPDGEQLPSSPSKLHRNSVDGFDFNPALGQNSTASPQKNRTKSTNSSDDDLPLSQLSTPKKKEPSSPRPRKSKEEITWPRPGQNMWMSVDSQEQLDNFMKSLNQSGIRESKLHRALEKNYDIIVRSINKKNALFEKTIEPPNRRSTLPYDGEELHKNMATKLLQNLIRETCRGGLAEVEEPDIFEQRVVTLENVSQFSSSLLELFEAIPKKFLKRYMTGVSDRKKKGATEQNEEELVPEREKVKAENRVIRWKQAVEEATLYSRFCFLLAILNNSIKWELYTYRRVNARRRVARNKNYADVEADPEPKEEEEEESSSEEDEGIQRRSSRIRQKRKPNRIEKEEEDSEEESEEEEPPRKSSRIRKKRQATPVEEEEEEDEEESEQEEEDESEEEVPQRSTRLRKRKATRVEDDTPAKRTRHKRHKYTIESSEDEDSDQDEEETTDGEKDDSSEKEGESEEASDGEESDDDEITVCRNIIEKLMKYQYTDIFRDPVDREEVPDYYDVITDPICLSDILGKVENASDATRQSISDYSITQLMEDMRLLLDNAHLYNAEGSYEMKQAFRLENSFLRFCRDSISDSAKLRQLRSLFKSR